MAEKNQFFRNVRKYKLMNTVMASFNTIMEQMIVMSQQIRGVKPCTLTLLALILGCVSSALLCRTINERGGGNT